jgi:hypothetical protein
MNLPQFNSPANINDFDSIPNQKAGWNEFISASFDEEIQSIEAVIGQGQSQFYNPTRIETTEPIAEQPITWVGFPKLIKERHPGNDRAAWAEAEQLLAGGVRPQDEYLEWHVTRQNGKITRVTFTCEGPEYWEALAQGYPRSYNGPKNAGATGSKEQLLSLYRQYISPEVQLADLFRNGIYNTYNKWNTTNGAMHLNQPNNTLGAEINIAAQATILREKNGVVLTDADELIECAQYGAAGRASDPTIGALVNALARLGYAITLQNPVGLYIDRLDTQGWTKPDGSDVDSGYWKILRGHPGAVLRAVYEVPEAAGFTVSDLLIGGESIEFGGQIADFITMKLTGVACRKGEIINPANACRNLQAAVVAPETDQELQPLRTRF